MYYDMIKIQDYSYESPCLDCTAQLDPAPDHQRAVVSVPHLSNSPENIAIARILLLAQTQLCRPIALIEKVFTGVSRLEAFASKRYSCKWSSKFCSCCGCMASHWPLTIAIKLGRILLSNVPFNGCHIGELEPNTVRLLQSFQNGWELD